VVFFKKWTKDQALMGWVMHIILHFDKVGSLRRYREYISYFTIIFIRID